MSEEVQNIEEGSHIELNHPANDYLEDFAFQSSCSCYKLF